ncbi:hypothetical protein [Helicobacter sp. 23-1045]
MKLFVSALEYSANVHLRYLLRELAKYENVELCGIFNENILDSATQKQFAINGKSICDINKVAVMGFVDVLKKMRFFLDLRKKCLNLAISADKILLMDSSSFNLPLAKKIKKIAPQRKIMYYILPQVWAWKAWRAKAVERYCDKLCAILPFEVERYAKKAEFVGHPLMDEIKYFRDSATCTKNYKIAESSEIFAFMPGSRLSEIRRIFPIFRQVKDILKKRADSANQAQFAESKIDSSLRGARSEASATKQSKQNPCEAPESRPLRGAKNREQGCSSATADFLLEAEKRGTPPKSEKRQLLARRGSGAGGAALLREKTNESNKQNNETIADSANEMKSAESHIKAQNLKIDFSLRTSHSDQNDKMDCHDFATQNLAMTENDAVDSANCLTSRSEVSQKNRDSSLVSLAQNDNIKFAESSDKNQHSTRRAPKFHLIIPHKFAGQNLAEIYGDLSDFEISFDAHRTLFQSDFAFICSGTATLECALIGTPFVLGYKTRAFEAFIARCFLKIKYIGLANILYEKIAEDSAFHTELVQDEMSAENLLNALDSANKDEFLQKSTALRKYLQKGSAQAVAKLLYDL